MRLLAFDTSGARGAVAVGVDGEVRAERVLEVRAEHAAHLLPAIDAALREVGMGPGDLDGLVVGEGPGSFTGIRVAAATAKGLARALGIPLRPVSSLQAAALAASEDEVAAGPAVRYALFDARGDRVYAACYATDGRSVEVLVEPRATRIAEILAEPVPLGSVFVGDGAARHRSLIRGTGHHVAEDAGLEPLARGLLRSERFAAAPAVDAISWEPRYVRASSAERARSA